MFDSDLATAIDDRVTSFTVSVFPGHSESWKQTRNPQWKCGHCRKALFLDGTAGSPTNPQRRIRNESFSSHAAKQR